MSGCTRSPFRRCWPRLRQPGVGIVAPQVRSAHGDARTVAAARANDPAGARAHQDQAPRLLRVHGRSRPTAGRARSTGRSAPSGDIARVLRRPRRLGRVLLPVLRGNRLRRCGHATPDYCTRYEPRGVATHIGGQSGRNDTTHAMQIVNRVRLYRRRHRVSASLVLFPGCPSPTNCPGSRAGNASPGRGRGTCSGPRAGRRSWAARTG